MGDDDNMVSGTGLLLVFRNNTFRRNVYRIWCDVSPPPVIIITRFLHIDKKLSVLSAKADLSLRSEDLWSSSPDLG